MQIMRLHKAGVQGKVLPCVSYYAVGFSYRTGNRRTEPLRGNFRVPPHRTIPLGAGLADTPQSRTAAPLLYAGEALLGVTIALWYIALRCRWGISPIPE